MIIYFSGTGNSKFVAERLSHGKKEKTIDATPYIKEGKGGSFSDKEYIFVSPTYAWRLPVVFENFLASSTFTAGKCYFVMTCGGDTGNAKKFNKILAEKLGLEYKGTATIVMPENYIALFYVPDREEGDRIVSKALPVIDTTRKIINNGENIPEENFALGGINSTLINKIFLKTIVKDKAFRVKDNCIGCGLCEKKCPVNNVVLKENKPFWQGKCIHCMACISFCPVRAIEYGNSQKRNIWTLPHKDEK